MKRILALTAVILLCQSALFAQKGKPVSERDVPERYVNDFTRQAQGAKDVKWEIQ